MNYLSHYAFNHVVGDLEPTPWFVLGVAVPDLWGRVSRERRIHWPSVRAHSSDDPQLQQLRDGLLNHVDADAVFHQSRNFLNWVAELADRQPRSRHHAVRDFLAHVAIELALDHHLVLGDETLADGFYAALEQCARERVEPAVAEVGRVEADGLRVRIDDFLHRSYLHAYREPMALRTALRFVLGLVRVELEPVSDEALDEVVAGAIALADPPKVWQDLQIGAKDS